MGIRDLKQNASAVVARVRAGESFLVTDRGRAVARLTPLGDMSFSDLVNAGHLTGPKIPVGEMLLATPGGNETSTLSTVLNELRNDARE